MGAYVFLPGGRSSRHGVRQWLNIEYSGYSWFDIIPADGYFRREAQIALMYATTSPLVVPIAVQQRARSRSSRTYTLSWPLGPGITKHGLRSSSAQATPLARVLLPSATSDCRVCQVIVQRCLSSRRPLPERGRWQLRLASNVERSSTLRRTATSPARSPRHSNDNELSGEQVPSWRLCIAQLLHASITKVSRRRASRPTCLRIQRQPRIWSLLELGVLLDCHSPPSTWAPARPPWTTTSATTLRPDSIRDSRRLCTVGAA